jgi:alpha-glucosidase
MPDVTQHHAPRPWWQRDVVYQIYVRSFADSDGDGIGDLEGIRLGLPYLADLGVDGIWLTPCYPSPQHDHGYDVADFFDIEPAYGDLATFDRLVADAHRLGMRVLMDIVPNHLSIDHQWFRAALGAAPGSRERARFVFRDGRGADGGEPPNNWRSTFGGPAWTRVREADGTLGQWYLHTFAPEQPDLDWTNPEVGDHIEQAMWFWFDRGVDGFRCDAVTHAGKAPGLPDAPEPHGHGWFNPYNTHRPETHEHWRRFRLGVDRYEQTHPGRELATVCEAYAARRPDLLVEYVRPDEFHTCFAFDLTLSAWHARSVRSAVEGTLALLAPFDLWPVWALNNHDNQRTVTRYGRADAADPRALHDDALTPSHAPVDEALGRRRARAAIVMQLALPGASFVYQGEELGLPEVLDLPDEVRQDPVFHHTGGAAPGRDGCRIPLPWRRDGANVGFSPDGTTADPWLPQPSWWGDLAADVQRSDPHSVLALYRHVLAVRRATPDLHDAPLRWRDDVAGDLGHDVLAWSRGVVLVLVNLGRAGATLPPDLAACELLVSSVAGGADPAVLAPDEARWLRTG